MEYKTSFKKEKDFMQKLSDELEINDFSKVDSLPLEDLKKIYSYLISAKKDLSSKVNTLRTKCYDAIYKLVFENQYDCTIIMYKNKSLEIIREKLHSLKYDIHTRFGHEFYDYELFGDDYYNTDHRKDIKYESIQEKAAIEALTKIKNNYEA